jgi:Raf kinase inhibitor-like YbhB/YbcL family protein
MRYLPFFVGLVFCTIFFGEEESMAFTLKSPSFSHMGEIPAKHTCQGQDSSPALTWENPPAGTKSFVLIVDDPDAPDPAAPKLTWVHWVLYNIPANAKELPESVKTLPPGTLEGVNNWGRTGYGGPCPPIGRHRYFFKLYALSKELSPLRRPSKDDIEKAMEGSILGKAELIGTYQKH